MENLARLDDELFSWIQETYDFADAKRNLFDVALHDNAMGKRITAMAIFFCCRHSRFMVEWHHMIQRCDKAK